MTFKVWQKMNNCRGFLSGKYNFGRQISHGEQNFPGGLTGVELCIDESDSERYSSQNHTVRSCRPDAWSRSL